MVPDMHLLQAAVVFVVPREARVHPCLLTITIIIVYHLMNISLLQQSIHHLTTIIITIIIITNVYTNTHIHTHTHTHHKDPCVEMYHLLVLFDPRALSLHHHLHDGGIVIPTLW